LLLNVCIVFIFHTTVGVTTVFQLATKCHANGKEKKKE